MVSNAEPLRQRLPAQDSSRLSLVSHQPRKLREWVDGLPMMNVGETSRQVFQTLQELTRLQVDAPERLELLEILRPTVHAVCNALAKHYLNQSVMLPERATKVATLAQAMQSHLATGYKSVVVVSLDKLAGLLRAPAAHLVTLLGGDDIVGPDLERDRHQPILPWQAPDSVPKISPVTASQRYLEHLQKQPSLIAVGRWVKGLERQSTALPQPVQKALEHATKPLARYRCAACGFEAKEHFWHCPGCQAWDSYSARRIEEL